MISCASISSGTLSLPRSGSLPSSFAAAMRRVGEADLARRDLQDLLEREVARGELEVDQPIDELIQAADLVAYAAR